MKVRALPIIILEAVAFGLVMMFIWLDEVFQLPDLVFSIPPGPTNYHEAVFESGIILVLGVVVVEITIHFIKRITQLEQLLPICMFCKRIRREGTDPEKQESWEPMEQYLNERVGTRFSHGFCPECGMKHYGGVMGEEKKK